MSQLTTTPLLNPTTQITLPNQRIFAQLPIQDSSKSIQDMFSNTDKDSALKTMQPSWVTYPNKSKFLKSFVWTLGSITPNWFNVKITYAMLSDFIPTGPEYQSFIQMANVVFTISRTDNAYFAGWSKIVYCPIDLEYIQDYFDVDLTNRPHSFLMKSWDVDPQSSEDIEIEIPLNYLFNFIKTPSSGDLYPIIGINSYMMNLPLGELFSTVVSPLKSKSINTNLTYRLGIKIGDYRSAGSKFITT